MIMHDELIDELDESGAIIGPVSCLQFLVKEVTYNMPILFKKFYESAP